MRRFFSTPPRGIFVLNHHGFGNVVLSLPLIQAISRWALNKCIVRVLFRGPEYFQLIQHEVGGIEPIYLHTRYQGLRGLFNIRKDFGGTADLLLAVPGIPVSTALAVKVALGADHMAGEALPTKQWLFSVSAEKGWTKSILQSQQELALSLGLQMDAPYPVLRLIDTEEAWGRKTINQYFIEFPYPLIGVQCGAKERTKQWPVHSFGKALALLKSKFPELGVINFGSKEELASTVAARTVAGVTPWLNGVGKWTIRESLAILQNCAVILSGDTGIMHMAASLGIPTVSVFGPTSPERLAPLYSGGLFAKPSISCHPCFRDKWTYCKCIELISPEEIVVLVERLLGSQDPAQVGSLKHH